MNKFQKLSQINKDIEILEANGKFESATVLHNNFLKISNIEPLDPNVDPSVDIVPPSNYPYLKRPVTQMSTASPANLDEKLMQSIEAILKSNSPYKNDHAQRMFDKLMKNHPWPTFRNEGQQWTPQAQKEIAKVEKIRESLSGRFHTLYDKYRIRTLGNPNLEDTMTDVNVKSTPEQAQNSATLQAQYKAILDSKKPRMQKYRELMIIHQNAEKMWEQGKISRAGVQTFRDSLLKTEMLNAPYPIPGDPGFKPQII